MRTYKLPDWVVANYDSFLRNKEARVMNFKSAVKDFSTVFVRWGGKYDNPQRFKDIMVEIEVGGKKALISREEILIWLKQA